MLDTGWRAEKLPHSGVTASTCFQAGSSSWVACSDPAATGLNSQQDGHRSSNNAMSYSMVGSFPVTSCVKDDITGLVWEGKEASGARAGSNTYTHLDNSQLTDASGYVTFVNAIQLCGYSDWRLPMRQELLELVDHGRTVMPRINSTAFPNTPSGFYWTSQPVVTDGTLAWRAGFGIGSSTAGPRTGLQAVRLVRGAPPEGGVRFTFSTVAYTGDTANNVVNDAKTGLQWRRCEEGRSWTGTGCSGTATNLTHEQALALARDRGGWRMPHVKELASLTDLGPSAVAFLDATAFPGALISEVWASTPDLSDNLGDAWSVSFGAGTVRSGFRGYGFLLRLVRTNP